MRLSMLAAMAALILVVLSVSSSAIIIEPDKSEYLVGEKIRIQVYTAGNASIQLIANGSVVWEKKMDESGEVIIPTSSLSEGNYTIYASDDRGEVVKSIKLKAIKPYAEIHVPSKVEGNLTICGKTNLPDGYRLTVAVDGSKRGVKINDASFCSKFEVGEGVYDVKVLFEGEILNETQVYVEGFKIRSVRFQPEIYVGEPLKIGVSANLRGFDIKVVIYNNKSERRVTKHVSSDYGEVTFENLWMTPGDYSVLILVTHGSSTDMMKLPLRIKESFLSAKVENTSDNKVIILANAPINHVLWFISGSKIKKSVVGWERETRISMDVEGDEVIVVDQMNSTEKKIMDMLNSGKIELPHVKLKVSAKGVPVSIATKTTSALEKSEKEKESKIENQTETNQTSIGSEGVNLVAAILTVLIVGSILVALVFMIRR